MPQRHDIGHQKRHKNAEALKLKQLRRQAARALDRNPMHSKDEA
jgi:hypothetical protein